MEQLLGVDLDKWLVEGPDDEPDRTTATLFFSEVNLFGLRMYALAIRVECSAMADDFDDSLQSTFRGSVPYQDADLDTALRIVTAGTRPYGWHGENEGGYGWQFNPVFVEAWQGYFGLVIVSARSEDQ